MQPGAREDAAGSAELAVVCRNPNARRRASSILGDTGLVARTRPWVMPKFRRRDRYAETIGMPLDVDKADKFDRDGNSQQSGR
jgi:hypothetical protein